MQQSIRPIIPAIRSTGSARDVAQALSSLQDQLDTLRRIMTPAAEVAEPTTITFDPEDLAGEGLTVIGNKLVVASKVGGYNESFEYWDSPTQPKDWTVTAHVTQESAIVWTGNYSARVQAWTTDEGIWKTVPVFEG